LFLIFVFVLHVLTNDYIIFRYQNIGYQGEFVAYKHTQYPQEVRIKMKLAFEGFRAKQDEL
jgi:hypothetical protein